MFPYAVIPLPLSLSLANSSLGPLTVAAADSLLALEARAWSMAAIIPLTLSLSHKFESGFSGCSCSSPSAHPRDWSMAATIPWHRPVFFPKTSPRLPHHQRSSNATPPRPLPVAVCAFRRSDFDGFARRVASGEALRDAWRSANEGIEQLAFEARRATERMDRRYAVSNRIGSAARAAASRAREIDLELGIGRRWRAFSMDFSRSLPRYRKELSGFLGTPIGRGSMMVFFFWFAFSGWLFRLFVLAICVLPFAAPLLIGKFANSFALQGACPACKRQFVGYRNQVIRCAGCRNIVWQPGDDFSRSQSNSSSKSSEADIIDIQIEEK